MPVSNPEITVLMTVYNGGEYLNSSIESVLKQSFSDIEFLIINDRSRDDSEHRIRAFKDQRIRLVNNDANLGQTCSLNKGLSLAKGRYVARMDADDLAFPTWLEKNYSVLKSDPLSAVVSCKAVVIDGENKIQKILNTPETYEQMVLRSLFATPINHVGAIFKTDVIRSFGGYEESLRIAADFELWSKLIRAQIRLASVPQPLVAVRVHNRSISVNERGRADVVEISGIMARNFKRLVTFDVSMDEILLLWKLNYATEMLSFEEFRAAAAILKKAYANLNPDFAALLPSAGTFYGAQEKVLYAKRAFSEIEKGNLSQLRALAGDYQQSRSWANMFSFLWLASWLGQPAVKQIPRVYRRWSAWTTRRQLHEQQYPEYIH